VTFGRSKEKKTAFFELILLCLTSRLTLRDRLYLTSGSTWKTDAAAKSMGHILPDGPYRLGIDDLINRVVYGCIIHQTLLSGIVIAQMKSYWQRAYAIQQDEKLADIPDPKGLLGPLELPLVAEDVVPTESIPPSSGEEPPAPSAQASAVTPPPASPPAVGAKAHPADDEMEGISDADLAEAFAYAKRLRAQKEGQKQGE
jgi:hypothetical protein